jgi:hypothetical protein
LIEYFRSIENPAEEDQADLYEIIAGQFHKKWELQGEIQIMTELGYSYAEESASKREKGDVARLLSVKRCDTAKHIVRQVSKVHASLNITIEVQSGQEYDRDRKKNGTFYVKPALEKTKEGAKVRNEMIAFKHICEVANLCNLSHFL